MKSLTIAYCSARQNCEIEWFLDSLSWHVGGNYEGIEIIFVDFLYGKRQHPKCSLPESFRHVPCKPTVWQGNSRLTKDHWWAKSAYLNTAICLANGEWLACVDDRSVLLPGWLKSIKEAMEGNYAVAGSYSKRVNMRVENGIITDPGINIGVDPRNPKGHEREVIQTYGDHWFGCNNALPLEWALNMNGWDESCDSLGYEDVIFGNMLIRNGYITKFDPRMRVVQDRTLPDSMSLVGRTDKGISPKDKSHGLETKTGGCLRATHHWDLRTIRANVQAGQPFPAADYPTSDWWDNQPLKDFP